MLPPIQGQQQQQQYGGQQQQQQQAPVMTVSPAPAAQAARPPPKKGPQTFEEMGVPAAPKESECVSRCLPLKKWYERTSANNQIGVDVIPRRTNDCDEDIWIRQMGGMVLAAWKEYGMDRKVYT